MPPSGYRPGPRRSRAPQANAPNTGSTAAATGSSTTRWHIIAVTRAQHDPATNEYLARKEAEGKTKKGALRSLKRHLARRFHQLLSEPPTDQQPTAEPESKPELPSITDRPKPQHEVEQITAAPCPMVCIS
jgi:hypothetical protein